MSISVFAVIQIFCNRPLVCFIKKNLLKLFQVLWIELIFSPNFIFLPIVLSRLDKSLTSTLFGCMNFKKPYRNDFKHNTSQMPNKCFDFCGFAFFPNKWWTFEISLIFRNGHSLFKKCRNIHLYKTPLPPVVLKTYRKLGFLIYTETSEYT